MRVWTVTVPAPVVKPVRKRKTGLMFTRKPWLNNCSRSLNASHGKMEHDKLLGTRMPKALTIEGPLQDALQQAAAPRLNGEPAPGPRDDYRGSILGQGQSCRSQGMLGVDRCQRAAGPWHLQGGWPEHHGVSVAMDPAEWAGAGRPGHRPQVRQSALRESRTLAAVDDRGERSSRGCNVSSAQPKGGLRVWAPSEWRKSQDPSPEDPRWSGREGVSDL